tara:strand:+ start:791 stop:1150 length:360 start_codon:yes stop_codon:yes gene_type:complete
MDNHRSMNFAGDSYQKLENMMQHKYLRRLEELHDRIEQWKQIGPACSEQEWDDMETARDDISELLLLCRANVHYKVPAYRLKKANRYWHQYSIMNIETVKIAAGVVADVFKEAKDRKNG